MIDLECRDPIPPGEMPLDEGIRSYVLILRAAGIATDQSCQGGDGHPCPEPMVRFQGSVSEGFKAYAVARDHGLPVQDLRRVWTVIDGELTGPCWVMTFKHAATE